MNRWKRAEVFSLQNFANYREAIPLAAPGGETSNSMYICQGRTFGEVFLGNFQQALVLEKSLCATVGTGGYPLLIHKVKFESLYVFFNIGFPRLK